MTAGSKGPVPGLESNEGANSRFSEPRVVSERRREVRYVTNDVVQVRLLDGRGGPPITGTMIDISRSGIRVEVPLPIGRAMWVEVILGNRTIIFAEARHCELVSTRYQVGMAIEAVCSGQNEILDHIAESRLSLYRSGGGLPVQEAIRIANHLFACIKCQARLANPNGRHEVE